MERWGERGTEGWRDINKTTIVPIFNRELMKDDECFSKILQVIAEDFKNFDHFLPDDHSERDIRTIC